MMPHNGRVKWSRLRPVQQNPLDAYGLPSKGETRLHDFKTQELYYTKIIERYLAFCTEADGREELLAWFASFERASASASESAATSTTAGPKTVSAAKDLSDVLLALRKLREAIVATKRADDFSVHVYLFCIRQAILARQPEAYHPAILYLLRVMARQHPLTRVEAHEVTAYLVLDAACRRGDLAEAYRLRSQHRFRNRTVDGVLAALARDDWLAFRRLLQSVDGHQAKLLECAEHGLRVHTLKCFGRAYLRLDDVAYLESVTGMEWADLQRKYGVGWERDGKAVIIRKAKPKTPATRAAS
ncbi:hypothetical protein CMQ_7513 [Grosmannia clavigera kw1407]|uniref:Uncharacterized protein n=1 Tax=Grosmannia clavigera (strain kw1407 / UAMH 11150) TaxID=655863 RepID=F0XPE2_GROCL|nr:uncharacterized protein CMQ_7513 [Grosmannia clavigera kw1407]EFX00511.1 hypothetical protein CMQ_7513 [Grosmannia clavigera kw1407]